MSPVVEQERSMAPVTASTPLTNGHYRSSANGDDNANLRVSANLVTESTNSMDILSGGESDVDTLSRRNNNSISSCLAGTLRDPNDTKRRSGDVTYYIAKELLMTERTYKRDLELVTVTWSSKVSCLVSEGADSVTSLARACLALEPLALLQGEVVARLELSVGSRSLDNEEPEYKKVGFILQDYMTKSYDAYISYMEQVGTLVGLVESARRCNEELERTCASFDATNVLPLSCLLLRPLHRILYLDRISELLASTGNSSALAANELCRQLSHVATSQLRHVENHAQLCQLQRLILGYDKLLVAHREFIRLGCLYKHSGRGLQQRILFLFSDVLVIASKAGSSQFRAHVALPLHKLDVNTAELANSFSITGDDINIMLSASNELEFLAWCHSLHEAINEAKRSPGSVDAELTPYEQETSNTLASTISGGGALTHVCWHRVTSIDMHHLHLAMRTQLSGFLLRKFKNSHGWQKLWVVFAAFTLFFFKSWQDDRPLASLPLLGYSVGAPNETDNIHKEFVFKLQFKNHIYFFRADSQYTYNRWTEALQAATVSYNHNGN